MDPTAFRAEFPFFSQHPQWVYLDNAATSHKPRRVLERLTQFYQQENSNVHRSAHHFAAMATEALEHARAQVLQFCQAPAHYQLIWSSGATMALNQIAFGVMGSLIQPGDLILVSELEHHANLVPWQFHCQAHGVEIAAIPVLSCGELDLHAYQQLLARKPKLVALTQLSNGTGYAPPVAQMLAQAKQAGAMTVLDGCQGIAAGLANLQELACDFYVCSGHKIFGPTGIGALIGASDKLEQLKPLLYGGEMIQQVSFAHTSLNRLPYRLEAGTPNIAGAIGFGAALEWFSNCDPMQLWSYKRTLAAALTEQLTALPEVRLLSPADNHGIVTFCIDEAHHQDVAELLNAQQIACRSGRHCAMPLFAKLAHQGAVRLSVAPYNNESDIEQAVLAVSQAIALCR